MTGSPGYKIRTSMVLCLFALVVILPGAAAAEDIRYDGTFALAANGDVNLTVQLTPPMVLYKKMRDSISNLYLVMREFSESRADTEVVNKKADWDDSNRAVNISLTMLGVARNLGTRWEMEIPKGADFINLDEAKKTLYFNEAVPIGDGATIRGTSKLVLPPDARQFKWEASRRVVTYMIPAARSSAGATTALLIGGAALMTIGLALTVVSFTLKPAPVTNA